ncbi:MAG TPA: AAA family ATPase [Chloroflexota bacterium]|nr:AAA family ATPase [Chloroflexota bacterium]
MVTKSRERLPDHDELPLVALNPLFLSKTRAPTLPRPHLARPRLIGALRQGSRRRVTLVCAPAGAGKTTLVADFARSQTEGCWWYTIDDLDADGVSFLHGLAIAVGSGNARSLDRLGYLAQIVESLGKAADHRAIVVDDVHLLTEASAAQALSDLLRYLPRSARLILVGRCVPPGLERILDWLATQGQLAHLRWDSFQLGDDERDLAASVFKTRSAGAWILAWANPEGLDLARYLRTEVLRPLGSPTVERLARLSVLPSFDPPLAAAVAGIPDRQARDLLDRVQRTTPLLEHLGNEAYRFSETARAVLADVLSARELDQARRAAGFALRDVAPGQSAECFLDSGEPVEAARSLCQVPLAAWLTQSPGSLHDLLCRLSPDEVSSFPRLLLSQAWARIVWSGQTEEGAAVLSRITLALVEVDLRFWCLYVSARANVALGQNQAAMDAYSAMLNVLDQVRHDPTVSPATTASMLCRAALLDRFLGDSQRAVATAEQGLVLAELTPSATRVERQLLHHVLGGFLILDGHYQLADQHLNAALTLADDPADVAERATIGHAQAGVARCRGEFVRALGILDQALREPLIPTRERMLLTLQAAHALADVQDFRGAAKRYRTVASMLRRGDRDGCFSRALSGLAICCTFLGLDAEAETTLVQLRCLGGDSARYDLLLAEGIRGLRASDAAAAATFSQASRIRGTIGGLQDTWQAVLLEAQAWLRQDQRAAAEKLVADFLAAHAGQALPAIGLWALLPVQPVLATLNQRNPNPSIAALLKLTTADPSAPRLLHAVAAIDQTPAGAGRQAEVRLFGTPRLIVDGDEVAWPYGLRHKAVELFWYSALHPDGFTREQALADLYPERDPSSALKLLQVTTSNLRTALSHLLGAPGVAVLSRVADDSLRLQLDAIPGGIRLETRVLVALADELRSNRRARLPATIPALFRGELLAGLAAEWVEPIRRYWMAVYLRTLGTLATRYARQGVLQQAIHCHELALQVDPTLESAHAELMRLYHAAGDRQAVESQMWLYTRIAQEELDTAPADDVEELYQQLIASGEQAAASPT